MLKALPIKCSHVRVMKGIVYLKIEEGLTEFLENVVESLGFKWYELEDYKEHSPEVFITESNNTCLITIGKHVILKFNPKKFEKIRRVLRNVKFLGWKKKESKQL